VLANQKEPLGAIHSLPMATDRMFPSMQTKKFFLIFEIDHLLPLGEFFFLIHKVEFRWLAWICPCYYSMGFGVVLLANLVLGNTKTKPTKIAVAKLKSQKKIKPKV